MLTKAQLVVRLSPAIPWPLKVEDGFSVNLSSLKVDKQI